jgi:hypothetical protein
MGKVLGSEVSDASLPMSSSMTLSSSPDVLVAQESILALAIISVGHVTFHSVESDENPAADTADDRDVECRRLFAETLAEGGLTSLLQS